jgi:hypothetical protein
MFHVNCFYTSALNKLEKVALRCARKRGRPLVLVFNNVHFFQHTEEGTNILLQLQQRAESWAESGGSCSNAKSKSQKKKKNSDCDYIRHYDDDFQHVCNVVVAGMLLVD